MRLHEVNQTFYHGSAHELRPGTILEPQPGYAENWGSTAFYRVLEKYRPKEMLAHHEAVFMVADEDDVDLAGAATDYLLTVKPIGKTQKHDLNWASEISMLTDEGYDINSPQVKEAAKNYWAGVPHYNESVWEYLATKAIVLSVEPY